MKNKEYAKMFGGNAKMFGGNAGMLGGRTEPDFLTMLIILLLLSGINEDKCKYCTGKKKRFFRK